MKKVLMVSMIAATIGAGTVATPAAADIEVRIAPPAPRYEVVPPARHGYIWTPGYWDWRSGKHVWIAGNYVRERPGYRYSEPRWYERNGHWYIERGHWARGDKDHDGVPNQVDRAPSNPYRS